MVLEKLSHAHAQCHTPLSLYVSLVSLLGYGSIRNLTNMAVTRMNCYRYHTLHVKKMDLKLSSFRLPSFVLTDAWNLLPVVDILLFLVYFSVVVVVGILTEWVDPLPFFVCIYDNGEYCDECVMLIIFPFRIVCDMNSSTSYEQRHFNI